MWQRYIIILIAKEKYINKHTLLYVYFAEWMFFDAFCDNLAQNLWL
jgi:hypothetical protein